MATVLSKFRQHWNNTTVPNFWADSCALGLIIQANLKVSNMVTTSNYREIIYNNPQIHFWLSFFAEIKTKNWEGMCLLLSPNTNWRRCTKPCSAFAAQCSVRAKSAVEADQSSANARLYLRTCTSCKLHTGWKSKSYSDEIFRTHRF